MSDLSRIISSKRKQFLGERGPEGASVSQFRKYIDKLFFEDEPQYYSHYLRQTVAAAATLGWREPPRRGGPDLFSIDGYEVAEYLTRPKSGRMIHSDDDEHGELYQKVDSDHSSIQDLRDDATIHARKALESAAAVAKEWKAVDEAVRRANGDFSRRLRDVADEAERGDSDSTSQGDSPVA